MHKFLALVFLIISYQICQGQTTIEDIEEGSHLKIGIDINSRIAFAGQSLGINGPELLPTIYYQNKSGFYLGITPSFYTDVAVTKKSKLPNADFTVGYIYETEKLSSNNSITHSQVFYGNAFFRKYLSNALSSENTYAITKNFDASLNGILLFSKAKKIQLAPVFESSLQYHFYIDDALGADQLRISPSCSYFFGSDRITTSTIARDSITETNKKNSLKNNYRALSIIPCLNFNWQKENHEIGLGIQVPIANTEDAVIPNKYSYSTTIPIFSVCYNFYFGLVKQ